MQARRLRAPDKSGMSCGRGRDIDDIKINRCNHLVQSRKDLRSGNARGSPGGPGGIRVGDGHQGRAFGSPPSGDMIGRDHSGPDQTNT
ncbi:MAG: hypothetical protein R3D43_10625 [Tepidamorphaceae bacterium]